MNIPNSLTFFRLLSVPVIVAFYYKAYYGTSTIFFILAAISDGLDGYAARHANQVTPLGSFLDPVADKILVVSVIILLIHDETLDVTLPGALIILREILMSSLREWMAHSSHIIPVSNIAKTKTVFQMVALTFLLSHEGGSIRQIGYGCLWISVMLSWYSLLIYLKNAWSVLTFSVKNE